MVAGWERTLERKTYGVRTHSSRIHPLFTHVSRLTEWINGKEDCCTLSMCQSPPGDTVDSVCTLISASVETQGYHPALMAVCEIITRHQVEAGQRGTSVQPLSEETSLPAFLFSLDHVG